MKIPIFNSIYPKLEKNIKSDKFDMIKMNNLNFQIVDPKRFPVTKLLFILPKNYSLFETVIVSVNDTLVDNFLKNKIKFNEIGLLLFKIINRPEFKKYKKIPVKSVQDIIKLKKYVSSKTNLLCI